MISLFKNTFWYIIEGVCTVLLRMLKYVPGVQEAYDEAVARHYSPLIGIYLLPMSGLFFITDHFKTQKMYNKEMDMEPRFLPLVAARLKTQEMCEKAVEKYPWLLKHFLDWFVTRQEAKLWDDHCIDDGYIKWYNDYQKRKAQKAKIKEELLPIAWHPSRYWDWCMSEDKKSDAEKLWA